MAAARGAGDIGTDVDHGERLADVRRYFDSRESRWGYTLLLRGRKHFGYYPDDGGHPAVARAQELMEDRLADRLGVPEGSRVLDAGSGDGIVAARLAGRRVWYVVGIDLMERNAAVAERNAGAAGVADRTEFLSGDYTRTGLPSCGFDAAYTLETLVHAPDSAATLAELHRVLRPGGRLACAEYTVPHDADMDDRMRRVLGEIVARGAAPSLPGFVNGTFGDHLAAAGFVGVEVEDLTERIVPMLRLFARLGRAPYWLARRLGLTRHVVNAQFGVEWYRYRDRWRYVMATATKAGAPG